MTTLQAAWLGRVDYSRAFALQQALAERRAGGEIGDTLLLLEHDPVYTLGRRANDGEILLDPETLAARGIEVQHTDRGGRVTYHGPGQLVGYPIVDLGAAGDLVAYVRALETAMIATCAQFGVGAATVEGLTGVWAGNDKIGAIGVHVSRGITTHGFALNVTTDLSAFGGIIPCGIVDRGVTSLQQLTGSAIPLERVARKAGNHVAAALGTSVMWRHPSVVLEAAGSHV
ncbi:MAG TPA: lipoyl(octanoyl) transferase LipB [Actinomycetota bacterium]|nr:lipoyl(octanoyl) transferase LipB [Actinomycetota bacterium]